MRESVILRGEGGVRARWRIVVADAHRLWRHTLRKVLEGFGAYCVVGEAASGEALLEQAERARPDLILTDAILPVLDGIETLKRLRDVVPVPRALVLSEIEDPEVVREAFAAGAIGYISKCEDLAVLRRALGAVCRGFSFLSPRVARGILEFAQEGAVGRRFGRKSIPLVELELLRFLAKGWSDKGIAAALGLGLEAVNYYRLDLLRRLSQMTPTSNPRL
ncbi:Transcriptional regulatory protein DegU [bacterium HR10]|nr:Transcriptional regulatory protein DegU [bacterium HR10]